MAEPEEIAVLRQLAASFPVPVGRWHGFSEEIAACRDDFAAAVEAIASDEAAAAALRSALEGAAAPPPGEPELAAAVARLAALPAPEGRHPFVDDIFPALEGMHAALAAVGASAAATMGFARRRST